MASNATPLVSSTDEISPPGEHLEKKLTPASFYILSIQIYLPFISNAYQSKQLFIRKAFYDENGEKISLTIFLHTFRKTLFQRNLRKLYTRFLRNVGARASVMFL